MKPRIGFSIGGEQRGTVGLRGVGGLDLLR